MAKSKITVELTLKDGSKLVLDKSKIKNIESLSQTNADASTIFYGVLASSGRLEILDYDGTIKRYIQEGIIDTSSIKVDIYINGVLTQSHISSDSNYANESSIMTIELTNKLSLWDTINYGGYYYQEKPESAYEMLKNILLSVEYEADYIDNVMLSDYIFDTEYNIITIKEYLNSISIEYPYLPSDTLRATIDKFCTLAQLNVVLNNNGDIKFTSARPLLSNTKNIIQIPLSRQYGEFTYSVILKNKYDCVEIPQKILSLSFDTNYPIGSFNSDRDGYIKETETKEDSSSVVGLVNYVQAKVSWLYGQIKTIPKISNYGFNKIIEVYTGVDDDTKNPKIEQSLNYTKKTDAKVITINPLTIEYGSITDVSGTISKYSDFVANFGDSTVSIVDRTNLKTAQLQDMSSHYIVDIIVASDYYAIGYQIGLNGDVTSVSGGWSYEMNSLTASLYGLYRESEESEEIITFGYSKNNPISIEGNELLQNKTTIKDKEITLSECIANNILSDYSEGVSTGTLTVAATNYFDKEGNKVVDISKGQTIKIGDVISIEGDDRYWRVTGANQRKTGTPYMDLEVMQVKQITSTNINIDMSKLSSLSGVFTLPIVPSTNFVVHWGDGSITRYKDETNVITHTYSDSNFVGEVKIYGEWNGIANSEEYENKLVVTKIEYDNKITSIPISSLAGYENLANIKLSNSIKRIEETAFAGCAIENIIIPDNVVFLGNGVFFGCKNLKTVEIGDGVENIGPLMFYNCENIETVTLGTGVKTIEEQAFWESAIQFLVIKAIEPPVLESANYFPSTLSTIYIPVGTLDAYQTATNWSSFSDKFVEIQ